MTGLSVGDVLHVSDIDLGEDVDILVDPERTICSVQIPKVVVVEEEVPEEELEEGVEEVEGEAPAEAEAAAEDGDTSGGDES